MAHPRTPYWQAHLLPDLLPDGLGIQLCRHDFHGERAHDFYIDIASISRQEHLWTLRHHSLDLPVRIGLCAETDEPGASLVAGHVTPQEFSVAGAHTVLNGLAHCGCDVQAWLGSQGLSLDWNMVDWDAVAQWADAGPSDTGPLAMA